MYKKVAMVLIIFLAVACRAEDAAVSPANLSAPEATLANIEAPSNLQSESSIESETSATTQEQPTQSPTQTPLPEETPTSDETLIEQEGVTSMQDIPRWYLLNRPGGTAPGRIIINPHNPVYRYVTLSSNGLLFSSDGGETWTNVSETMYPKDLDYKLEEFYRINDVIFDPIDTERAYALSSGTLFQSEDFGSTWDIGFSELTRRLYIGDFAISSNGQTRYMLTNEGLRVSPDGGTTYQNALERASTLSWSGYIATDAEDPLKAYAVMENRLYVTNDAGVTWTIPSFLSTVSMNFVISDEEISGLAYALTYEKSLYRTTDGGNSWGLVADLNESDSQTILKARNGIVFAPQREHCGFPLIVSSDRGETWQEAGEFPILHSDAARTECPMMQSLATENGTWWSLVMHGGGLTLVVSNDAGQSWEVLGPYGKQQHLTVSRDNNVLYTSGYRVFSSKDGGNNWEIFANDLPWYDYQSVEMSQQDPNIAYVYGTGLHQWETYLGTNDGGKTWQPLVGPETHYELFPETYYGLYSRVIFVNPTDHDHIIIGVPGLVTKDRGTSWQVLPGFVRTLAANPENPQQIFLGFDDGGLYWTSDGGETVQPRGLGTDFQVLAVSYDPNNPQVVHAVAATNDSIGLYTSEDGGVAWGLVTPLDDYGAPVIPYLRQEDYMFRLIIDPRNSSTMYLLSRGSVWKSADRGSTWMDFNLGLSLVDLPSDMVFAPPMLYVVGVSGVWRLATP